MIHNLSILTCAYLIGRGKSFRVKRSESEVTIRVQDPRVDIRISNHAHGEPGCLQVTGMLDLARVFTI